MCQRIFAARFPLKDHLIKLSKDKKPRCTGLKKVIPSDVWVNEILPHYAKDVPLPEISRYTNKKRKLTPLKKLTPGSRHITRRLTNVLKLIEEEATEQNITVTSLLGLLIHKVNYVHDRDIAAIGWSLFKGESVTKWRL